MEATCSITSAVSLSTPPACRRNSNYLPTPLRVYQHANLSAWLPLSLTDLSNSIYTYLLDHAVMILHARMLIIEVNSHAADSLHIYSDFILFGGWSSTNGYKWHGGRNAESGPDMSTSQKTLAGDHLSGLHNTCDHVHECTQDPNICQKTMLYLQLLGSVRLLGIGRRKFNTSILESTLSIERKLRLSLQDLARTKALKTTLDKTWRQPWAEKCDVAFVFSMVAVLYLAILYLLL